MRRTFISSALIAVLACFSIVCPQVLSASPVIVRQEASAPIPAYEPANSIDAKVDSLSASSYPVFFVTDRNAVEKKGKPGFGSERSSVLTYGEYSSSDCRSGDDFKNADMKLFDGRQQFMEKLKAAGGKSLAVFVHGYRKSFEGSMELGFRMARHLGMPLVVFAWPSKNKYLAYMQDECTAEWSSAQLAQLLDELGQARGFSNIALVSHSLGARIMQWSLKDLYAEHRPRAKFAAALFFSPDVDRDTFLQNSTFLNQACRKCYVYVDKHDSRIWMSRVLHGNPRVGSSGNAALARAFKLDTSLPSHQIPFELVVASVHGITDGGH